MEVFVKVLFTILWLQGYVRSAPRRPRLSVAESPTYHYTELDGNPEVYSFSYDVSDPDTGNIQFRAEDRYSNGTVIGNYGYIDAYGVPQKYRYIADENGYRVFRDVPSAPVDLITNLNHGNEPVESSVTWSRPKKFNKEKNNHNVLYQPEAQRPNLITRYNSENQFLLS